MSTIEAGVVMLAGYLLVGGAAEVLSARWRGKRHDARWNDVQRTLRELAIDLRGEVFDEPVVHEKRAFVGTLRRFGQARVSSRGLTSHVGVYDPVGEPDDGKTWIRTARPAQRAWLCQSLSLQSAPGTEADRSTEAVFRRCFAVRPDDDAVPAAARIHLMELAARAARIALEPNELLVVAAPGARTRFVSDRLALRTLVQESTAVVELLTAPRQGEPR
jgi:hypothetical protein